MPEEEMGELEVAIVAKARVIDQLRL